VKHLSHHRARQSGVSLIELMVALIIGLFLIFGAVTIYQQSRTTFRTTESVARLQEVARLAMDVLEADIRMANYWGLGNKADYIVNRGIPGLATPAPFTSAQAARINLCGTGTDNNWAIALEQYIVGADNSYDLDSTNCAAFAAGTSGPADTADTLVIRRGAEAQPVTMEVNRIYLQTSRIQGTLFVPTAGCLDPTNASCIPSDYTPPASQTRQLNVHAYYVSDESTLRTDVPSLRRKVFGNVNAGTATDAVTDEEIVPGIEDMQIRFGVDTNGLGATDDGLSVDQYVEPDAIPPGAEVVSATIWLRIRSEDRDISHVDGNTYQYANIAAFTPADNYRRIVVSKTIQLRNTRS
jgi:type IV pilus assembly protein PilW